MFDMKNQKSGCEYAGQVLDYIYNEMADAERSRFESHLGSCGACPDEVASLIAVSGTIGEWKAHTFDTFDSPKVLVQDTVSQIPEQEVKNRPLISTISEMFGGWPLFWQTGTAVAVLFVTAGVIWFLFAGTNGNDIAVKPKPESPANGTNSGKNTVLAKTLDPIKIEGNSTDSENAASTVSAEETERAKTSAVAVNKSSGGKNVKASTKKNLRGSRKSPVKASSNRSNRDSVPTVDMGAPEPIERLSELAIAEDVEDESLRLTELFAIADSDER